MMLAPSSLRDANVLPPLVKMVSLSPLTSIDSISPPLAIVMTSVREISLGDGAVSVGDRIGAAVAVGAADSVESPSPHATPITISATMPIVVTNLLFTFISCSL